MRDLYSKPLFISLILFIFSFILRVAFISKGAFSSDCLSITLNAERLLDTHRFQYHFGFGYPLTILIAAIFVAMGRLFSVPDTVLAVNFMSVVFGSLCVVLYYHLVKNLLDKTTAFFSAVLFSLCPIFFGVSVFGIGHTPSLFFLLLALLLLIPFFKTGKFSFLLLSALSMGASGAARVQDFVLFLPALFTFFFLHRKLFPEARSSTLQENVRHFIIFIAVSSFVTFLFHLPFLFAKNYFQQLGHFQKISTSHFTDLEAIRTGLFFNAMYLTQTLSVLGILLSAVGFVLLGKERRYLFIFILVWILIPFYMFCHLQGIVSRHQVLILPAFIMAQGYLLARLFSYGFVFRFTSVVISGVLIMLTFGHYAPYFAYRNQHSPITEYSRWLGTVTEPNARIISTDIGGFIQRYANRQSMGRMLDVRFFFTEQRLLEYKAELDAVLDQGNPIYITYTGLYTYDFNKRFSNFIKDNFTVEYVGTSNYEDWHRDYLQLNVFENPLYQIKEK